MTSEERMWYNSRSNEMVVFFLVKRNVVDKINRPLVPSVLCHWTGYTPWLVPPFEIPYVYLRHMELDLKMKLGSSLKMTKRSAYPSIIYSYLTLRLRLVNLSVAQFYPPATIFETQSKLRDSQLPIDMATPLHITFAESVQAQRNDDQPREALIHSRNGLAALWSKSTLAE
jgi:hypothetical protein